MITLLSQSARDRLTLRSRLQQRKREADDVRATREELQTLLAGVANVRLPFDLVRERLDPVDQQVVIRALQRAAAGLQQSRDGFATTSRQVKSLRDVSREVAQAEQSLLQGWQAHVRQELDPSLELLRLVESLPQIQQQGPRIRQLKEGLQRTGERLPKYAEEVSRFDQELAALKAALSSLGDLSPGVTQFLRQVLTQQATLADLTDEVLTWCRQDQRSGTFAVQFKLKGGSR